MDESFDWERIDDYDDITGVAPLDKALAYADPTGLLKQHLARREREHGASGVVADLEAVIAATPPDSPAHDGCSAWLARYRDGVNIEDL